MPQVKYMRVAADWFLELCKGEETRKARPIAHALPTDARFVDAKITETGWLILIIESKSYPELKPGETMTQQAPTEFEVIHDRDDNLPPRAGALVDEIRRIADSVLTETSDEKVMGELHVVADKLTALVPKRVH